MVETDATRTWVVGSRGAVTLTVYPGGTTSLGLHSRFAPDGWGGPHLCRFIEADCHTWLITGPEWYEIPEEVIPWLLEIYVRQLPSQSG